MIKRDLNKTSKVIFPGSKSKKDYNLKKFNKICKDIKSLKIQGAKNVAKAGLKAYNLLPTEDNKKKILSLRPTEAMLQNILDIADKISYKDFIDRLNKDQEIMNKEVNKLISNNSIIFTHCHSSSVIEALKYSKNQGKRFEVYNTETRPLFQGRKTAKELKKEGIKVTLFVDSAAQIALTEMNKSRSVSLVLLGSDAITKKGSINKIGSGMFAQIARANKIPVYIIADSLKFSKKEIRIEERNFKEVWKDSKRFKINIKNPAFSLISKEFITGIISELGTLTYKKFLKRTLHKHDFQRL